MDGHAFPLAAFVPTAFALSYLGVRGGLEYHRVPGFSKPVALFDRGGSELVDLQTLSVVEAMDFELRLHELIAVFGSGYGRARVGVNTPSLLGDGGDYSYGGDGGVLVRLLHIDNFQLSVRAQVGLYAGQQAGILGLFHDLSTIVTDAFNRLQQNPTADVNQTLDLVNAAFRSATSELLTPFDGIRYGASVNAAQAFGKYFGAQLALGASGDTASYRPRLYDVTLGSTVIVEQRSQTLVGRGAVAVDFDAAPAGIPFDFMLEYALELIRTTTSSLGASSQNASNEHLVALGAYYSGRPDLQLGGALYTLLGQLPQLGAQGSLSGKPQDAGVQLVFHYIW
jgi:hypothetical protein